MKKTFGSVLVLMVGLAMLPLPPIAAQQPDNARSRSARFHRKGQRAIPNHYIVVLDRDVTGRGDDAAANAQEVEQLMPDWGGTVTRRFNHAVYGFSAIMTEEQALALS